MSEVVFVYLSDPKTAGRLLWSAREAASTIGAVHFEVMAVRISPEATIMPTEEIISKEACERIRREESERTGSLRKIYDPWAREIADRGNRSDWIDVEGLAGREMAARGGHADLIVIDRLPHPISQLARDVAHAALFDCQRPVLVIPPDQRSPRAQSLGKHVAIAWKDDGRAIKAAIPAVRYFSKADHVTVLEGYRGEAAPTELPPAVVEHDIAARLVALPIGSDPFGKTLLEGAQAVGADVLVMGAYAHSLLREMLLGGVTRYLLAHADIPVFMRH